MTTTSKTFEDQQRKTSDARAAYSIPSSTSRTVPVTFTPPKFGGSNVDADAWLAHFQRYVSYRQLPENEMVALFPLFLEDTAFD